MSPFATLYAMTNEALLEESARLAAQERRSTSQLIAAISEIDARRLFLAEGCSSTFMFCTRVLKLSEHAAYDRITAARLARRFPVILERLGEGTLTLSNLTLIAPHITADNCEALLDAVASKSKRDVESIVAGLRPQLASPEVYRLQLSVSREAWDQLCQVQDLLQHSIHDGDPSRIFERAIAVLLAEVEKKKIGKTTRPGVVRPTAPTSRHVPAHVRREVSERDGGQCAFVGPHGRCGETRGLEFHHVRPHAAGGTSEASNIQLRCRAHNQHESELFFGRRASAWRRSTRPGESNRSARGAAKRNTIPARAARAGARGTRGARSRKDSS